jgi:hypothetical protein
VFLLFCSAREYLGDGAGPAQSENPATDAALAGDLLDRDIAITQHCKATGIDKPERPTLSLGFCELTFLSAE